MKDLLSILDDFIIDKNGLVVYPGEKIIYDNAVVYIYVGLSKNNETILRGRTTGLTQRYGRSSVYPWGINPAFKKHQ